MYCPNCGKEIKEKANFCMHCGKELYSDTSIDSLQKQTVSPIPNTPKDAFTAEEEKDLPLKNRKNKFLLWIEKNPLTAVLSLIGVLVVLFFITFLVTTIATEYQTHYNHYKYTDDYAYNYDYDYDGDDTYDYDDNYGNHGNDRIYDEDIQTLCNTTPEGESVTYDKAFQAYFHNGYWGHEYDSNMEKSGIFFEGSCVYQDKIADVYIRFQMGGESTPSEVFINDMTQNQTDAQIFIDEIFDAYQEEIIS